MTSGRMGLGLAWLLLFLIAGPAAASAVEATVRVDQEMVATDSDDDGCAGCGGCACEGQPPTVVVVVEA